MGASFTGEGEIDPDEASSVTGRFCEFIGPLECDEGVQIECSGVGLIDCTWGCPGSEAQLDGLMAIMQNISSISAEEFPLMVQTFSNRSDQGSQMMDTLMEVAQLCGFQNYLDLLGMTKILDIFRLAILITAVFLHFIRK